MQTTTITITEQLKYDKQTVKISFSGVDEGWLERDKKHFFFVFICERLCRLSVSCTPRRLKNSIEILYTVFLVVAKIKDNERASKRDRIRGNK